jgi:hypothetical protein
VTYEPPLLAPLPQVDGGFGAVHIDLPVTFASNSDARPGRNVRQFYCCYPPEAFAGLPIKERMARDAWAFALNPRASTLFFTVRDFHFGLGFSTRHNAEVCLLAKKGKPKRLSAKVPELIIAPRRQHSRKPDETFERIQRFAKGPYLDLFGRQSRPGWTVYGDEATKFDRPAERLPLEHAEGI